MRQKSSSSVGNDCIYTFHTSDVSSSEDLRKIKYIQSLTVHNTDGSYLSILVSPSRGETSVKSTLIPAKASIDIPNKEWVVKAVEDGIADEVWVGLDSKIHDRFHFRVTFQKPVYKDGERVAFVDSRGKVLGSGCTNDFTSSIHEI